MHTIERGGGKDTIGGRETIGGNRGGLSKFSVELLRDGLVNSPMIGQLQLLAQTDGSDDLAERRPERCLSVEDVASGGAVKGAPAGGRRRPPSKRYALLLSHFHGSHRWHKVGRGGPREACGTQTPVRWPFGTVLQ